jgi:hypothetical protein
MDIEKFIGKKVLVAVYSTPNLNYNRLEEYIPDGYNEKHSVRLSTPFEIDIPAPKEADYPKILEMIEKAKANVAEEAKRKRMEIMQKELTANYWLERLRCQVLQLPPPTPLAVNTDGSIEGSLDDRQF